MIRFDNDHHGTLDAGVDGAHPIIVIPVLLFASGAWEIVSFRAKAFPLDAR